MKIRLEKAIVSDAKTIFDMQVKAFTPLLEKYKDYDISPANEKIDRTLARINNRNGGFYKILADNILVGAICIWRNKTQFWISPMFISPKYQGRGIAQKAIRLVKSMFPEATSWELATLLEEKRNCYLYEKMGFIQTGIRMKINNRTTLVYYRLEC
ncbi:GNAT family N-acetyltransferase [Bacillus sp. RG28]|uniref:GNAT family N-acetyltransferase n=1 Tax=Gottfriedia endophytica TaxID=2820819 RepID=A0A940NJ22_9BACI|nr:GNAT family N-acetyltransferase [Gottfriedia endophytica]MBP0726264.1 GNAT family N-acetyltransferase [Gottfriedia endophytica]